jgi:probable F420-dependent oxidoreductase
MVVWFMKFSVALGTDQVTEPGEFVSGAAVGEISRAVEHAGLDAVFVTDHPAPDDRWLAGGGHHALEPTIALSFAAAATTTLMVHTHIYVLAYRNPFLAAKSLASLDVLSGGRSIFGIAAGYLRPEFRALGMNFDDRNDRTDESVRVMRQLWDGESVVGSAAAGDDEWKSKGVTQLPSPATQPRLWFGGNSRAAIRRSAELGDGWSPFPTNAALASAARTASIEHIDHLAERVAVLDGECERLERADRPDICFGAFAMKDYLAGVATSDSVIDELGTLEEIGVTWTTVSFPATSRAEMLEWIDKFSTEVVGAS